MEDYQFPKHMKRLIRILESFTKRPIYEMSPEEIDRLSTASIPNNWITRQLLDKKADHIVRKTLRIPTAEGPVTAYLYTKMEHPNDKDRQLRLDQPLILFFHGGGWVIGHTVLNDFYCSRLAEVTNSVVLSVDYRLAPQYRYPCAVHDAYAALQWASLHAPAWGARSDSLFVMGGSAGGNLAAAISLKAHQEDGPAIAGQILIYPVTDGTMSSDSYVRHAHAPQLDKKSMEFFIDAYKSRDEDVYEPLFSPLLAPELTGLPPALVITAEYDPLHDEGIRYGQRLQQSGVEVEFLDCMRTIHGFINYPKANGVPETEQAVATFIERHTQK